MDERYSEAIKEAEEVDKFIDSGVMSEEEMEQKKPFLGVPISTKDSIRVKGMFNTAGCYHRRNIKANDDAPVVENMKKAGAIFFCLTNVPELCMWFESNNEIFGRTTNPYDTYRICGGSSGNLFISYKFIDSFFIIKNFNFKAEKEQFKQLLHHLSA